MNRGKQLFSVGLLAVAAFLVAMVQGPSSSGAPASHTGAPGEKTCATAGCHDDNRMNSGTAKLSVDMGTNRSYTAGKTYPIRIKITDSASRRFGFQIVALSNNENKSVGKFRITDAVRTQLTFNLHELMDREYVTYTFDGTDATSPGTGEWFINWKAPAANTGPITFYVGAVSANDNENDKGDFVYLQNLVINEDK